MGLDVVYLVDDGKQDDIVRNPEGEPIGKYKDVLPKIQKQVNDGIDLIVKDLSKLREKDEVWVNGISMPRDEAIAAIEAKRVRIVNLPKGTEKALKVINNELTNASETDQIILETHTTSGVGRPGDIIYDSAAIDIGGRHVTVPVDQLKDKLVTSKGIWVIGSCYWDEKTLQLLADDLDMKVYGTGGVQHELTGGVPKEVDPASYKVEGPAERATIKTAPNPKEE